MQALNRLVSAAWLTLALGLVGGPAIADPAAVAAATFGPHSVSPPTTARLIVCHGFDCKYRTRVVLTGADRAKLGQLLAPGKASAKAERLAVGAAGAWFDRRIARAAGTRDHVARAGYEHAGDPKQFDCIDSSRNTTSLLLILEQLGLLRHHSVDIPVSRGFFIDGRAPHTTAVLVEAGDGRKWAVDSWTRGYGEAPEIMPLARWRTLG
jgi:hypothetical protein